MPSITVLLATYNGVAHLGAAIDSILNQTWRDFELIVVDDGSTDGTDAILDAYAGRDPRVRVVHQPNLGLAAALNTGLDLANGVYIARMDADDLCLPKRLEAQMDFLSNHPVVAVCGTWVKTIGAARSVTWRYPVDDAAIRSYTVFGNPFAHSTVMLRRTFLEESRLRYNPDLRYAQDYDLWTRAMNQASLANLPQVHLLYRQHPEQTGLARYAEQDAAASRIRLRQLRRLGIAPTAAETHLHTQVSTLRFAATREWLMEAEVWLRRLDQANRQAGAYPAAAFTQVAADQWYRVCSASASLGLWALKRFHRSQLTTTLHAPWRARMRLGVKCLLMRARET